MIDLAGVNTDQEIWGGDAGVWRPERWLDEIPLSVSSSRVPSAFSYLYVVPPAYRSFSFKELTR